MARDICGVGVILEGRFEDPSRNWAHDWDGCAALNAFWQGQGE